MQTFPNVIQPLMNEVNFEDHSLKARWNTDFFRNQNPLVLELGCGKGEYSVGLAEKYPHKNFIGVDIKGARIWTGARNAIQKGLNNVAFLRTKIELINCFFGNNEVQEIWLTFPDPRMDKTRKRLTSVIFLEKYRRFLLANGTIHLKTDSSFLFQYTCALVEKNKLPVYAITDNLYTSELLNDELAIHTFYEKQWLERGIQTKYIAFGLVMNSPLTEPEGDFEKDSYRSFGRSANNN